MALCMDESLDTSLVEGSLCSSFVTTALLFCLGDLFELLLHFFGLFWGLTLDFFGLLLFQPLYFLEQNHSLRPIPVFRIKPPLGNSNLFNL